MPMECPMCNRPVEQSESPGGELRLWCPACGWGAGEAEGVEAVLPGAGAAPPPALWKIAVLWLLAPVIIVGPYFALRYGLPELFDIGFSGADEVHARFVAALNGWYWIIMGFYLAAAGLFTPTYDPDNVGWLGGMIDNPFSFQDDFERMKRTLLFLLLPGKVVWMALKLTWARLRS